MGLLPIARAVQLFTRLCCLFHSNGGLQFRLPRFPTAKRDGGASRSGSNKEANASGRVKRHTISHEGKLTRGAGALYGFCAGAIGQHSTMH